MLRYNRKSGNNATVGRPRPGVAVVSKLRRDKLVKRLGGCLESSTTEYHDVNRKETVARRLCPEGKDRRVAVANSLRRHGDENCREVSSSKSTPSSLLILDDKSIANIQCLGLRLVHLLGNVNVGNLGILFLKCLVNSDLFLYFSQWMRKLVAGLKHHRLSGFWGWKGSSSWRMMVGPSSDRVSRRLNVESAEEKPEEKTRGSRHVFLIRHGHYMAKERRDSLKCLTRLGKEQLILTGRRLREVGFSYDAIVSSTMTRASESAKIIADQLEADSSFCRLEVVTDRLLEEGAPLPPEPPLEFWRPRADQVRADGPRIEKAFRKYFRTPPETQSRDTREIIVCHANVIRYCVCRALQVPPQAWLRMWLNHGSITWLTIKPSGRIVLRALGASGYMPPEKLTAN